MRNYISEALAHDLYRSLTELHFLYADIVYDGGSKSALQNLQVSQNNALRVIKNVDKRYSVAALDCGLAECCQKETVLHRDL